MSTRLFLKKFGHSPCHQDAERRSITLMDLDPRIVLHYEAPSIASILVVSPIQELLTRSTLEDPSQRSISFGTTLPRPENVSFHPIASHFDRKFRSKPNEYDLVNIKSYTLNMSSDWVSPRG
ncbi:hypothetical protein VitviT2T_003911 [Vitis vinifera]|uniref:Uncharacterized protein n=1 Tax=Vitis vinifera TaxID=29760 RepID=A0ABY9BNG4_VITVI|nr:hypothetical protein VitviT2T_003911 [Vitis vinifera]